MRRLDHDSGEVVNETRDYLSKQRAKALATQNAQNPR